MSGVAKQRKFLRGFAMDDISTVRHVANIELPNAQRRMQELQGFDEDFKALGLPTMFTDEIADLAETIALAQERLTKTTFSHMFGATAP